MDGRLWYVASVLALALASPASGEPQQDAITITGVFASTELMVDLTIVEDEIMKQFQKLHLQAALATETLKNYLDEWRASKAPAGALEPLWARQPSTHLSGGVNGTVANAGQQQGYNFTLALRARLAEGAPPGAFHHPVHHPVEAYMLIKRRTKTHNAVVNNLIQLSQAIQGTVSAVSVDEEELLPTEDDLRVAAASLVEMQRMYKLDTAKLVSGDVRHIQFPEGHHGTAKDVMQSHSRLGVEEALTFSRMSAASNHHDLEKSWLHQAVAMIDKEGHTLPPQLAFMAPRLDRARQEYDDPALWMQPDPVPEEHLKFNRIMGGEEDAYFHKRLCSGYRVRTAEAASQLFCRLNRVRSPYLLLMPLKMEVLSISPPIFLYHDFLTNQQTQYFMNQTKTELEFAAVKNDNDKEIATIHRTSTTAFIGKLEEDLSLEGPADLEPEKDFDEFLTTLNKRIGQATGLKVASTRASEAYQAVNYGIGGLYNLHADYGLRNRRHGERLVTFLMYLSDVSAGGATVFPRVGVGVQPRKGAALVWYNLRPNGDPDPLMMHAACPVLHGNKWITTKWILYDQQFDKFPCGLSRYQKTEILQ